MTIDRSKEGAVDYTVEDGIAWVKLNRQMIRAIDNLEYDDAVGVLALAGEGDAWSAGMDLKEYFRET